MDNFIKNARMPMMLKNKSTPFLAFLQASGLVTYIILISLFFNFVAPNLGNTNEQFFAPILMLLLFTMSATISATIVLGRFAYLFWEKKYKNAFELLGWTVGWGVLYFVIFLLIVFFNNTLTATVF
jgi:hypothetical protein